MTQKIEMRNYRRDHRIGMGKLMNTETYISIIWYKPPKMKKSISLVLYSEMLEQ